ncbi:MAG: hypothetical protein IPL65_22220 [Lewinellaceae bacterium]|nr:hypothetical protein [Lewinellaceae bacterium]
MAEANLARLKALLKEGVTAQAEFEKAESERQQQVLQHLAAQNQYLASKNAILQELAALSESPEQFRQEKTVQQTSLTNELEDNQHQILSTKAVLSAEYGAYTRSGLSIYLLAESDGVVVYTFENNKELEPAEFLIKITTPAQVFRIAAKANAAQIGRIAQGQKVVLKFHSFPFFEYGAIRGLVENCASSPDTKGLYPIDLSATSLGPFKDRLQDGLTGDAVVFLKEKSFFGHLASKVNRRSIFHTTE